IALEPLGQALAAYQLGDHVDGPLVPAGVEDGDDAGMTELGNGPGFAKEPLLLGRTAEGAAAGQLDRYLAPQLGIAGPPARAERPSAQEMAELVTPDLGEWRIGGWGVSGHGRFDGDRGAAGRANEILGRDAGEWLDRLQAVPAAQPWSPGEGAADEIVGP